MYIIKKFQILIKLWKIIIQKNFLPKKEEIFFDITKWLKNCI